MRLHQFTTIRVKLILTMLTIIFIVTIVVAYVSYLSYLQEIKKNLGQSAQKITQQLSENIDSYFRKYLDLTVLPHYDRKIEDLLTQRLTMSENDRTLQDLTIKRLLELTYIFPYPEISRISLYLPDGEKIELFQGRYEANQNDLHNTTWFKEAVEQKGRPVIADSQTLNYNGKPTPIISFIRQLNVLETRKPYATFVINIPFHQIATICSQASFSTKATYTILNESNQMIYSQKPYQYGENYLITLPDTQEPFIVNSHGEEELISSYSSPESKWRILSVIPISSLSNQTTWIRNTILLAAVASMAIGILLSLWFTNRITKPILRLKRLMKIVESGDFNQTFISKSNDELSQLGISFNRMILKIKELIENVYLLEIRQKDARLNTLQAQINPHFLFNTLETIRMIAEVHNNQEISKLIQSLGNLLQETIRQGRKLISVQKEIEYISNYFVIQSYRHQLLHIEIDIEDQIRGYFIPPLLLQPLVENAVDHGLKLLKGEKKITIHGYKEGDDELCFTVEDNGKGISPMQVEQLNQAINQPEPPPNTSGIGLWNVQQRIILQFGSRAGLQILSTEEQGTRVVLRMPILTQEANIR